MAKISFSKLGLKINQDIKTIEYNGQIIEIKQYLPIQEKLQLISNVINLSSDENNFANPVKVNVCTMIEMVDKYTNINFTDKQKEDIPKLYDLLVGNNLVKTIISEIPEDEYFDIVNGINKSTDAIYTYRNSALGILEIIKQDYSNLDLNAEEIQKKLNDPNNMALLREVLDKLG